MGIYAPAVGAVVGAFLHFAVQLPLAWYFGFRPNLKLDWRHPGVRAVGRLAGPRVVELAVVQVGKVAELFLASLVSTAAYAYYTLANSLQLLPVSLFGASIAKAALPAMANRAAEGNREQLAKILVASFREIVFLTLPAAIFLAVTRIPLTRIAFGAARFDWESTVQTGYVVSAFSVGVTAQAVIYLLTRAFYALHETRTPVQVSVGGILGAVILGIVFIRVGQLPVWSLALAYSLAGVVQAGVLLLALQRRVPEIRLKEIGLPVGKMVIAAASAGGVVYLLIKRMDRVIFDTRYTAVLILFVAVLVVTGLVVYGLLAWWLRIEELGVFTRLRGRLRGWRQQSQLQQSEVVSGERESL
jgi:putative peptidoglycan lipid II flippase